MIQKEISDYDITSYTNRYNNIYSTENNTVKEKRKSTSKWTKKHLKIYSEEKELRKKYGFPIINTNNSLYNTANLYLNKKNYIIKNKKKHENKYFEKEQLFDKVLKLKTALNNLNQKYTKQKIQNVKQLKEIEKHNKFLNTININNFKVKRCFSKPNINTLNKNINIFEKEEIKSKKDINDNKNQYNNNKYYKQYINYLKDENEQLKENYDKIRIVNETLISNLKKQCLNLEKENESKNKEIDELKKSAKCIKYNELLKERDIYEKEMKKMKKKLNDSLKQIYKYKIQEEEIKKLYEDVKKKDFKIKALEVELLTLSNNLDETVQKLEDKLVSKDKIIKRQEREIKFKLYINNNEENKQTQSIKKIKTSQNKTVEEIYNKNPELYQIYIEMKQKGINSSKIFINNILKKLEEVKSISDNKIIFIESIIELFNIQSIQSKSLIIDLANKEFMNNQNLSQIKSNQILILDILFNNSKNKTLKNNQELKNILISNEGKTSKMYDLFEKYDSNKKGFITFNQMKEIIKEVKLDNIKEDILLYTKSEIFDKMNYSKLILLTGTSNRYTGLDENINKINNKLKTFADLIKKGNNSINDYLSYIKENIMIKNDEKHENNIEVVNLDIFIKFLNLKNIDFEMRDKELLLQIYGIDLIPEQFDNQKYQNYLDYQKLNNKLIELVQKNDNENNEDV